MSEIKNGDTFLHLEELNLNVSTGGVITRYKGDSFYVYRHSTCRNGYKRVQAVINGKRRTMGVHRLVAMAFIPNPGNKPDVNHIDGDKANNHVSNLEWSTKSENIKHGYSSGLMENVRKSKSKPKRNLMIKKLSELGFSQSEIADAFKMTPENVSTILKKQFLLVKVK